MPFGFQYTFGPPETEHNRTMREDPKYRREYLEMVGMTDAEYDRIDEDNLEECRRSWEKSSWKLSGM